MSLPFRGQGPKYLRRHILLPRGHINRESESGTELDFNPCLSVIWDMTIPAGILAARLKICPMDKYCHYSWHVHLGWVCWVMLELCTFSIDLQYERISSFQNEELANKVCE